MKTNTSAATTSEVTILHDDRPSYQGYKLHHPNFSIIAIDHIYRDNFTLITALAENAEEIMQQVNQHNLKHAHNPFFGETQLKATITNQAISFTKNCHAITSFTITFTEAGNSLYSFSITIVNS